jgi:hypothetical protein
MQPQNMPLAPADSTPAQATRGDELPLSPTEEIVAGVWQRVLGTKVLRDDDFFQLGGDSLGAAQVSGQLSIILRASLDLGLIFEHPTLMQYAAAINRFRQQAEGLDAEEMVIIDRADGLPLSFVQENRLLREARALAMGRRDIPFIIPLVMQVDGPVEDGRVVVALNDVIAANESLRTAFLIDPATESLQPFIAPAVSVKVELITAEGHPVPERPALLNRLQNELVRDPMALDQPPLLRARLVRFGPENRVLLLAVEHLVFDGWSIGLVISGMATALSAVAPRSLGRRLQYVDWAAWQRRHLSGATLDRLIEHWRTRLADAEWFGGANLPPPSSERESRRREVSRAIPAEMVMELRSSGWATGTTIFMLMLTAVVAAWHECTGDADIVVHTSTANRGRPETAELIGWLAHAVVLRFNLDDDATEQTYLTHVRDRVLEALLYQDLPLPLLVKTLRPGQYGGARPSRLFFTFEPRLAPVYEIPGGVLRQLCIEDPDAVTLPGLAFNAGETEDGGLALRIAFDQAEVDDAFVEELAAKIGRVLHRLADTTSLGETRDAAADGITAPKDR